METTRRNFLASGAAISAAMGSEHPIFAAQRSMVETDLRRYVDFGNKQSGGSGDNACGEWLASELATIGYSVERASFTAPHFENTESAVTIGNNKLPLWPQPIVQTTPEKGLTARIVRVDKDGQSAVSVVGAIALVDLPYGRWSSAIAKPVNAPIQAAFSKGAIAAIIVTNGPTGKAIALNADGREPMFTGPVAVVAPELAKPLLTAAADAQTVTLHIKGKGGRRDTFNVVGRMNRGAAKWLIISTPRSGWFTCGGERGGGIAAWLDIARWAPKQFPKFNLAFLCNSGHEYENLGAQKAIKAAAPKPEQTQFWLHLGANVAARDWHEGLFGLMPLPGTDSQRYLVASADLLQAARDAFAGQPGLESPYPSTQFSAGELTEIIAAGYPSVAGVFGVHRFHHVADDGIQCVPVDAVAQAISGFRKLLMAASRG